MMILMIRMSSNADEDLDEVNDEVEHPLPDADHQDSGAAVQCIPVIVISILSSSLLSFTISVVIIVTIFIRSLLINSNPDNKQTNQAATGSLSLRTSSET